MRLFSRKEEIPNIPEANILPEESTSQSHNLPELPSFPSSSKNNNMNQEMVKSAVSDPSPEENEVHVDIPKNIRVREVDDEESPIPQIPHKKENTLPKLPTLPRHKEEENFHNISDQKPKPSKHDEPVFVRIDKFQLAQKNLQQIKERLKKMESVMKTIKEVKQTEETELKGWTEDVEKVKALLTDVDNEIFDRI